MGLGVNKPTKAPQQKSATKSETSSAPSKSKEKSDKSNPQKDEGSGEDYVDDSGAFATVRATSAWRAVVLLLLTILAAFETWV